MKGKYGGRHMTIYGSVLPGAVSLANWAVRTNNISEKAKQRLKVVDWLRFHDNNVSLAARHFGLNRETVGIWLRKFRQTGMMGLNDKSHRPKNVRKPTTGWEAVSEIVKIRKQYPAWSKYKIRRILSRRNIIVSASTVGRVLKRKRLIGKKISVKRTKAAKNPRKRFPKGFRIAFAGDMVQVDVKHVSLVGGRKIYQFTAIDVLTKRRVLKYYPSLASKNGADFLRYCLMRFPFSVRNIQTDNGPEFLKHFGALCKELNLPHYFIYPRTPKQNTYVENSHGSDDREFYRQGNIGCDIESMQKKLEEWEHTWNYIRPHEALDYLTPDEYLNRLQFVPLPTQKVIVLQT
jgi:putative transposase